MATSGTPKKEDWGQMADNLEAQVREETSRLADLGQQLYDFMNASNCDSMLTEIHGAFATDMITRKNNIKAALVAANPKVTALFNAVKPV